MVNKERKIELISKFGKSKTDSGKAEVQIAIITEDINNLTAHLAIHKKDIICRRSLLMKVSKRRHLLSFLLKNDVERYKKIIAELNLRK
ncbi:30S ribosomal protein S15 [Spiroplasma endosymbiont of Aspidapion aeneum]|uniref:30S ribosomal protein S15 n=1 Tax=Spiroplasma endosymbiont of Aspidapion aeneum TaxID=3066276 RepID=UPI00313EE581